VARKTDVTNSPIPALGVLSDAALPPPAEAERLRREARRKLRAAKRRARGLRRRRHAEHAPKKTAVPPALEAIAACESHGNPRAIGGGGAFRGKYQFDTGTWASVGGKGDPAAAPEAEQDRRAAMLYARAGSSPWPVCG
jgi:Transglycosylase-like domain